MATADFRSILSHKVGAIEKPKPLPIGTYAANVDAWEAVEVGQKKTPSIKFTFKLTAPQEDVDMDQLEEVGGMPAVLRRKVNTNYWLTDDAMFRLRQFIEDICKVDIGDRSIGATLPDTIQCPVLVVLKHRFTDKQEIILDVDAVLPAE